MSASRLNLRRKTSVS